MKLRGNDKAGALAAYEESLAITRHLADTDPNDMTSGSAISPSASTRCGDVKYLRERQDAKGALAEYEESLALTRRLADKKKAMHSCSATSPSASTRSAT